MTDDVVIRAEGLGKRYVIGHESERERYVALRDVIARGAKGMLRKAADMARGRLIVAGDEVEAFWALKDVSFEVKRGEVLGIIGRNGAGKSTLLKILSRITEPSEGRVTIKGRVASLLEVGTGFHPELTGRENIFLNGAVLGMTRAEIRRKFDEIVSFSGVEKFLDTPVKRYSSGMYVRLAFAVAAHLEPDILVVDEVLAVGDAEFQKKCLGKMSEVASGGRTILFVSHNMQAVRRLCHAVIVLRCGTKALEGETKSAIESYVTDSVLARPGHWVRSAHAAKDIVGFEELSVVLRGEQPALTLECSATIMSRSLCKKSLIAVDISDSMGTTIMQALPHASAFISAAPGIYELLLNIFLPPLVPGTYWMSFWLGPHNTVTYDFVQNAISFEVMDNPTVGRTFPHSIDHGHIVPTSSCTVVKTRQLVEGIP
jgi:ABC-type polysaccharide/polyol phosphate transport system ATPase subunit